MKPQEIADYLIQFGIFVVLNKNLNLYQVVVDDIILYVTPTELENMPFEDLDVFLSSQMIARYKNGEFNSEVSLH